MSARSLAMAAAVSVGALLVGLSSAGVTLALLSARVETAAVTVTAGSFDVVIDGAAAATLESSTVTPSTPVVRSFTVGALASTTASLSAVVEATSAQPITANTLLRLTAVEGAADCVAGLDGPLAALDGYSSPGLGTITPGATRTFCLEVRLAENTPASQSGQSTDFTLTIHATQVGS